MSKAAIRLEHFKHGTGPYASPRPPRAEEPDWRLEKLALQLEEHGSITVEQAGDQLDLSRPEAAWFVSRLVREGKLRRCAGREAYEAVK